MSTKSGSDGGGFGAGSEAVTEGVRVAVRSAYVPERSAPADDRYFFAYRIRIANEGEMAVRLISREWLITDALGHREVVRGEGVVGEQPLLEPGEAFEYQSFCPLPTPSGSMRGTYLMVAADGRHFEARIAPFALAAPHAVN